MDIQEYTTIPAGKTLFKITGRIVKFTNKWGRTSYRIPTDKGVLNLDWWDYQINEDGTILRYKGAIATASFAILNPIKKHARDFGDYIGAKLEIHAEGTEQSKRYKVKVSK